MNMHQRHSLFGCLLLLFLFIVTPVFGNNDWPTWRGGNHDGIVQNALFEPIRIHSGMDIRWEAQVGDGYSAPSIKGNNLYITGSNRGKDTVYALNTRNGRQIWQYSYNVQDGDYNGTRCSPTIDGNNVYTLSRDGKLHCFDAGNGKVLWNVDLTREYGARPPSWGISGTVIIEGNTLLVNAAKWGIALNKNTGAKIWASPGGTSGYSSPVLFTYKGKRYAAIFGERQLYAVSVDSGSVLWEIPWQTAYDVNAADPLIFDNKVFIATGYGKGCGFFDFSSGKPIELWRNSNMISHFSSFIYTKGMIFGIHGEAGNSYGGKMRCIDPADGRVVWQERVGFGSMIMANDTFISYADSGKVIVSEVNTTGFRKITEADVMRGTVWTAPVLANGQLYMRNHRGHLICLDVKP